MVSASGHGRPRRTLKWVGTTLGGMGCTLSAISSSGVGSPMLMAGPAMGRCTLQVHGSEVLRAQCARRRSAPQLDRERVLLCIS